MGCLALLQGIFLTQGSNLGLSHCRQILYYLSHQGRHMNKNDILSYMNKNGISRHYISELRACITSFKV